jgi:uncharacterized protein (TIGR02271 family)
MSSGRTDADELIVPLHAEELSVTRRRVTGDTVRVRTATREREQLVDEELTHHRVEIERVVVDRVVDAVPPIREEGDVTIVPIVEEVVVVERRLVLKEEVHMRRVRVTARHRETVTVREQEAVITRGAAGQPAVADDRQSPKTIPPHPFRSSRHDW